MVFMPCVVLLSSSRLAWYPWSSCLAWYCCLLPLLTWPSVCLAVFRSARCGLCGGILCCLARSSVCAAVLRPARPSCRCAQQTSFMRSGPPFCTAWPPVSAAVAAGGAFCVSGSLLPCPARCCGFVLGDPGLLRHAAG